MIVQIKPLIQQKSTCPYCKNKLKAESILWQGIHICLQSICIGCGAPIIEDLKIGHAERYPFQIDLLKDKLFGEESARTWLGEPLLKTLHYPKDRKINISKEIFRTSESIIILNCIDNLYGHCLLKLLNCETHLKKHSQHGLIVIVPTCLRWLIPESVSEIWAVDIPLKSCQAYYPIFNQFVHQELERFKEVYVSKSYLHPSQFDISNFTKVPKHSFEEDACQITFIWREDRIWCNSLFFRILRKLKLLNIALLGQNWKLRHLFKTVQQRLLPLDIKFSVAGLGKTTDFPEWIEDLRVEQFDEKTEKLMCEAYSKSRLVIGVHGSNMLLPSGHAGMTIDLLPKDRWGNFAQDILYQEEDARIAAFRYRYLPLNLNITELSEIIRHMIINYDKYKVSMTVDKPLETI